MICRLALPFVLVRLWWQGRQSPELWENWKQRLGYVRSSPEPVIWVHAVSVGETIAAAPMVFSLLGRDLPGRILMTAMTPTGQTRARAFFGERVDYAFSPYDTPGAVGRFLKRVKPRALVIMETELWPNLLSESAKQKVPVLLINARMSERSARRYERFPSLVVPLLQSIQWIAAQAQEDADRFARIGARSDAVTVTGSIKFDAEVSQEMRAQAESVRAEMGGADRPVWIAASTHAGEDEQILAAHQQVLRQIPQALLVLVPRHPERFEPVAQLVKQERLTLARRSQGEPPREAQVYLADTMGELPILYGACDMAFVGGSLIERGGHNPLEPAAWGKPVLAGPHVFNFEVIYRQLDSGEALRWVAGSPELAEGVQELMAQPQQRDRLGAAALAVVESNRGALNRIVEGVCQSV